MSLLTLIIVLALLALALHYVSTPPARRRRSLDELRRSIRRRHW